MTDEILPDTSSETAAPAPAPIVFYCKDCKQIVDEPIKHKSKYEYMCPVCKGERVSFGTRQAISDFFQVKIK
ncbi:hypothetical protein IPG41_05580 [Candidatus Peregrinibacteria bacterium]|nr:MAG: hypothetical protein IPG41_05580 [Candidatus Peregrinibacteria bacterium]